MASFPEPILPLWSALRTEVVRLHARWKIYRQLFGTSKERVDLLNRSAAFTFRVFEDVLLRDVEITLSKLADRRRGTASLGKLRDELASLGEAGLASKLAPVLAEYQVRCAKVTLRRNKSHAHFDYALLTSPQAAPLPLLSRRDIEDALTSLRMFMNTIEGYFLDSEMAYGHVLSINDGDRLLAVLEVGLRHEQDD